MASLINQIFFSQIFVNKLKLKLEDLITKTLKSNKHHLHTGNSNIIKLLLVNNFFFFIYSRAKDYGNKIIIETELTAIYMAFKKENHETVNLLSSSERSDGNILSKIKKDNKRRIKKTQLTVL